MPNIRKLILRHSLEKNVIFHGEMNGEELGELYDHCDIAICSLECHRVNIFSSSALKSREYLAKGIPFLYSGEIDIFEKTAVDFAYQCPPDESPVNLEGVISFYKKLLKTESIDSLTKRIRTYAEKTIDMKEVMRPVAEYLKG